MSLVEQDRATIAGQEIERNPSLKNTGVKLFELSNQVQYLELMDSLGRQLYDPQKPLNSRRLQRNYTDLYGQAVQSGLLHDPYKRQLIDYYKLGRPKGYYDDHKRELEKLLDENDVLANSIVVEFPWRPAHTDSRRFVRILPEDMFKEVIYSRNKYVFPEELRDKLRKRKVAIAGMGLGTDLAWVLAMSEVQYLRFCDPGSLDLHDGNRNKHALTTAFGDNHAESVARALHEWNPYLSIEYSTAGLDGTGLSIDAFTQGVDDVFDVMDDLLSKIKLRMQLPKLRTSNPHLRLNMASDLGFGASFSTESATTLPFQGRLTPDVLAKLSSDLTMVEKTRIAAEVMVGADNIPATYIEAISKALADDAPYWPQPAVAANAACSLVMTHYMLHLSGMPVSDEISIDLQNIATS